MKKHKAKLSEHIKKDKGKNKSPLGGLAPSISGLSEALWKPLEAEDKQKEAEDKQLTSLEQSTIEQIEEKTAKSAT